MKRLKVLTFLLPFFLLSCKGCGGESPKSRVSQENPFSFRTLDGKKYTFEDLRGKVVVVEFFASWCPSCRMSLPYMASLYERYKDKGLFVVGLSFDQEGLDVIKRSLRIPFPVGYAPEPLSRHFGVTTLPTVFIFDKKGRIVDRFVGYSPEIEESIKKEVEKLLNERG